MAGIRDLYEVATPIFTKEMGDRMEIARMKLLKSQTEMAALLGIGQQTFSRLETGRQATCERPFTIAKMLEVFGDSISFILLGTGEHRFNRSVIAKRYWDFKTAKQRRKRGTGSPKPGVSKSGISS